MKNKWFHSLFRRRLLIGILLIAQLWAIYYYISSDTKASSIISSILTIASYGAVLSVISKREKGSYKLFWCLILVIFPVFGCFLYLFSELESSTWSTNKKFANTEKKGREGRALIEDDLDKAKEAIPEYITQLQYLDTYAGFPVCAGTKCEYLTPGEKMFEVLLKELEKAEKYIFMEYFIVQEGVMWNAILDVLKRKADQGVKVRIMYDDFGCFFLLPKDYQKQLKKYGIECGVFNPFRPFLTVLQNNRDHRKISSIDGKVAFTGGVNLADEYINAYEKHGHWKDAGIKIEGKAAWSLTVMFLEMWQTCKRINEDYSIYYPWKEKVCETPSDGFVVPYADSPLDNENVGEHVYLKEITDAKRYVYINTPYLIVDDSMISALTLAAKSGVDVRIVTPHVWDKFFVHMTTQSYYRDLIKGGVKIYEYTKGFIHSKTFVVDDRVATVGTTNLDFRSLYLHFECGVVLFDNKAVLEVKDDYLKTLEECQEITLQDCRYGFFKRLIQNVMRVIAPLM